MTDHGNLVLSQELDNISRVKQSNKRPEKGVFNECATL
jgi:hypothetical protein